MTKSRVKISATTDMARKLDTKSGERHESLAWRNIYILPLSSVARENQTHFTASPNPTFTRTAWDKVEWAGLDAEAPAITRGVHFLASRQQSGQDFTIFTDWQAAMTRIQSDAPGSDQDTASEAVELARDLQTGQRFNGPAGAQTQGSHRQ